VYKIRLNRHSYQRRNDWQVVREFGGGQLLNWGPHLIDHALQLLGNDADLVWCDLRRIAAAGDAEDHVHLILESKRTRAVAEIEISGGVAIGSPLYQVYGSTGGLEADAEGARLRYLNPDQPLPQAVVDLSPPKGFYNEELPWVEREEAITPEGITTIWDALYNTVRHGTEFPISSEDALAVMRVIHEAKKGSEFAE
jgi:predicted dehydrogenase